MVKDTENEMDKTIPKPRSRFLKVKCSNCGNIQVIYSHVSQIVKCSICGEVLAIPTGGKAEIKGEVQEVFE